jgi:HK97 gp10 family phage protein
MPIVIRGLNEIKEKLDRLSNPKTKLACQRAGIRAAAKILVQAQMDAAPDDTGKLKESIGMQIKKASDGLLGLIGPDKEQNYIGRFAEYGTQALIGQKNKGKTGGKFTHNRIQRATHWMQKSFDASGSDALDAYTATVIKLFDKHEYDDLMAAIEAAANASGDEE